MTVRAVVDRFEGELAVLEHWESGELLNVARSRLPAGTRAGDHLRLSAWVPDARVERLPEETAAARERVRHQQRRLRERSGRE